MGKLWIPYVGVMLLGGLVLAWSVLGSFAPSSAQPPGATPTLESRPQATPPLASEAGEVPLADLSRSSVPLEEVYFDTFDGGMIPLSRASQETILRLRDAIPPLTHPEYEEAGEASWLGPRDMVLGYAAGGQAYAYPLKILNYHEIVNEDIGGEPLLISYCPLCRSGVVYSRLLEGRLLSFGNTSALYESDLVMYDRQTGSYWHQVSGEAIVGDLTGKALSLLPSVTASWEEWSTPRPGSSPGRRATGGTTAATPFSVMPCWWTGGISSFRYQKKAATRD